MKKPEFPALFATTEPVTGPDGTRGETVRCTATMRELGFIWWTVTTGTTVEWHWRTPSGKNFGDRSTKRGAVQALRDAANASQRLPFRDDLQAAYEYEVLKPRDTPRPRPATVRTAPTSERIDYAPAPKVVDAPVRPASARRVVWDDAAPVIDLAARIAAGFKGTK